MFEALYTRYVPEFCEKKNHSQITRVGFEPMTFVSLIPNYRLWNWVILPIVISLRVYRGSKKNPLQCSCLSKPNTANLLSKQLPSINYLLNLSKMNLSVKQPEKDEIMFLFSWYFDWFVYETVCFNSLRVLDGDIDNPRDLSGVIPPSLTSDTPLG